MPAYDITIRVPDEDSLATIISCLKGAGELLAAVPAPAEILPPKRRGGHYVNGVHNKGIKSDDLGLELLAGHEAVYMPVLEKGFAARGFAKTSASVAMNKLVREGKIHRTRDGGFSLKKQPKGG